MTEPGAPRNPTPDQVAQGCAPTREALPPTFTADAPFPVRVEDLALSRPPVTQEDFIRLACDRAFAAGFVKGREKGYEEARQQALAELFDPVYRMAQAKIRAMERPR